MSSSINTCLLKTIPPLIVGSNQWVVASEAGHVDVILDNHDVTHFEVLVQASCCIGEHHCLNAEQLEDAHRQGYLKTHSQTLVEECYLSVV